MALFCRQWFSTSGDARDTFGCHNWGLLLQSSRWRPWMFLSTLQDGFHSKKLSGPKCQSCCYEKPILLSIKSGPYPVPWGSVRSNPGYFWPYPQPLFLVNNSLPAGLVFLMLLFQISTPICDLASPFPLPELPSRYPVADSFTSFRPYLPWPPRYHIYSFSTFLPPCTTCLSVLTFHGLLFSASLITVIHN